MYIYNCLNALHRFGKYCEHLWVKKCPPQAKHFGKFLEKCPRKFWKIYYYLLLKDQAGSQAKFCYVVLIFSILSC